MSGYFAHLSPVAFTFVLSALVLTGCFESEDERYDVGYDDGYAVGYNTTCEITATFIEGDFGSSAYSRGYNDGYAVGVADCLLTRQSR